MKRLLVLWDPQNPLVPAGPVIEALRRTAEVLELTFGTAPHRTSPNGAFKLAPTVDKARPDAILWIEGGPLPGDLEDIGCLKGCWIVNGHHEPTLMDEIAPRFDQRFVSALCDAADESSRWLPLAADVEPALKFPGGVWVIAADPKPPLHSDVERILRAALPEMAMPERSVVLCLGQSGQVHPAFFEVLNSGAAVVTDPESDLRGLAHAGEHLEVFPSIEGLASFIRELAKDPDRLARLAERGPTIVSHLHAPELRAAHLREGLWPTSRVLAGEARERPQVSVLAVCYRYRRRFERCLESLARQDLPPGGLEIVVADPASPDGLADYLTEFGRGHPHVRLVHLPMDTRYHRNRGVSIDRAFEASRGEVLVSIDGDIIFPPHLLRALRDQVHAAPDGVYGVRRIFINREETEKILRAEIDPHAEFERLSGSEGDGEEHAFVGVLGYCQAVHRSAFAKARYPQEFDRVNQSDIVFVDRLAKYAGVKPRFLDDERVLHLWHPRNWEGTSESL